MSVSPGTVGLPLPDAGVGRSRDSPGRGRVLVPLVDGEVSRPALETARAIASGEDAELVVLNAVALPEQTPLSLASRSDTDHAAAIARVRETVVEADAAPPVNGSVRIGHTRSNVVRNAVEEHDVGTVVLDESWRDSRLLPVRRPPVERIVAGIDASVVVPTGGSVPESPASILVPVADGPHSGRAADVARAIAATHDSWIELLHVVPPDAHEKRESAERLLSTAVDRLGGYEDVDTWVLEAESVAEAIVDQSRYYDATVIGAPRTPRLRRFVFGSTSTTVREEVAERVLTVWQ